MKCSQLCVQTLDILKFALFNGDRNENAFHFIVQPACTIVHRELACLLSGLPFMKMTMRPYSGALTHETIKV